MLHHVRSGDGPPLLLAHGIGMSHHAFDAVAGPLSASFTVVAVDLPGFGQSTALDEPPTMRALADACAETMAGLGFERFHAAGNSLGGGAALHLAFDGRALSACGLSPVGFGQGFDRRFSQVSLLLTRAQAPVAPTLARTIGRAAAVRRALARQYAEHADRLPADTLAAAFADLAGTTAFVSTLRHAINWQAPASTELPCPITIAWGEHDRVLLTGPQFARARERLPAARFVTLPDCGHLPAYDDPSLVAEVIASSAGVASGTEPQPTAR